MFRSKAEKKVREAGYDPARLPPGQYLTEKWPVLHAGSVPNADLATWDFRVFGEVEKRARARLGRVQRAAARPRSRTDIHCVTRWSRFDATFGGVHWRELAKLVAPEADRALRRRARRAGLHRERAARCARGRRRAARVRGRRRAADAGARLAAAPGRPAKYFWKSAKWLRGLELARDRPARLLGALRLPQRRRSTGRRSATASEADFAGGRRAVPRPCHRALAQWPSGRPSRS